MRRQASSALDDGRENRGYGSAQHNGGLAPMLGTGGYLPFWDGMNVPLQIGLITSSKHPTNQRFSRYTRAAVRYGRAGNQPNLTAVSCARHSRVRLSLRRLSFAWTRHRPHLPPYGRTRERDFCVVCTLYLVLYVCVCVCVCVFVRDVQPVWLGSLI